MTSNIGSGVIQEKLLEVGHDVSKETLKNLENEVLGLVWKFFRPEFLNRIDEIVMFSPLSLDDIYQIVKIQINF